VAAYEELRAWATGRALPGPRPAGLAVLLRFGVPAWLAATAGRPPPTGRSVPPGAGPAAGPPAPAVAALALVLATMVAACLACQPEGSHPEVQP
jgi:hypothetical protein